MLRNVPFEHPDIMRDRQNDVLCSLVTNPANIQVSGIRERGLNAMSRILIIFTCLWLPGSAAKSQAIYKTPHGAKYHLGSCRSVKNVAQKISLADAVAAGLAPCKICHPPVSQATQSLANKAAGQSAVTSQCLGSTKAGTRCKHRTSIANGYCYQHQP
jgi:uncharacterized protein DUF5763